MEQSFVVLPVISIELQRLVGYPPPSQDVVDSIQSQLIEAMWTRYRKDYGDDDYCHDDDEESKTTLQQEDPAIEQPTKQEDSKETTSSSVVATETSPLVVPPDFDSQIKELLDARMARFGPPPQLQPLTDSIGNKEHDKNSNSNNNDNCHHFNYLTLSYPPKIRIAPTTTNASSSKDVWLDSAQAWNDIQNLAKVLPMSDQYEGSNNNDDDDNKGGAANTASLHFLEKLTNHLLSTSRTLTWKHAMADELRQCLNQELWEKQHQEWISTQRKVKLDSLYTVRETLVYQEEMATLHYQRLCQERDERVSQELASQIHQLQNQQDIADNSSILHTLDLIDWAQEFQILGMFPRNQHEPLLIEDENYDDDDDDYLGSSSLGGDADDSDSNESKVASSLDGSRGSSYDSHFDEYDADEDCCGIDTTDDKDGPPLEIGGDSSSFSKDSALRPPIQLNDALDDESSQIQKSLQPEQALSLPFQRRKKRRQKLKEQRRKDVLELERHKKREALEAAQEELRIQYTTKEIILAQTKLQAFEKKVEDVDELLESLQDEVWAAEEEAEQEVEEPTSLAKEAGKPKSDSNQISTLTLVDQILAMILGALPVDPGRSSQEHYQMLKQEHETIVSGWKAYFGRLPPPALSTDSYKFDKAAQTDDIVENTKKTKTEPTIDSCMDQSDTQGDLTQ